MDRMVKEAGSTGHMKTLDPYGSEILLDSMTGKSINM